MNLHYHLHIQQHHFLQQESIHVNPVQLFASRPVPTIGASGRINGTAWRCMFDPISARLASSCSRNGISEALNRTIWFGATSMNSHFFCIKIGKSPSDGFNFFFYEISFFIKGAFAWAISLRYLLLLHSGN